MAGIQQREARGTPLKDFVRAFATASLTITAVFATLALLVFGWKGFAESLRTLLVVLFALNPIGILLVLQRITPLRVGANAEGFGFKRLSGRTDDFEGFLWDALVPGPKSTWSPFLGRKYPIRIVHAAGLGTTSLALSREQAELLASFPQGSGVNRLLD
ncbi:MAG: hypothetical protein L3J97_00095 [Thermoplasmata archaeon]|nr:hypothetical protein [Thermoplasmata archaeon]